MTESEKRKGRRVRVGEVNFKIDIKCQGIDKGNKNKSGPDKKKRNGQGVRVCKH